MLETLVVVAIFAVVSAALFSVFAATARNFSFSTKTVSLQVDLAASMNIFLDDVSLAGFAGYTSTAYNPSDPTGATWGWGTNADGTSDQAVIAPSSALVSVTLNGGTNGSPPDSIQFLGDIASPGSLSSDGRPDRITYQVTSGALTRTIELGDTSGGFTGGTTSTPWPQM